MVEWTPRAAVKTFLLGLDEDLGHGVPPVVGALAEVSDPMEATVHVDDAFPRAVPVAAVGGARGTGDGGAELVVFLGSCRGGGGGGVQRGRKIREGWEDRHRAGEGVAPRGRVDTMSEVAGGVDPRSKVMGGNRDRAHRKRTSQTEWWR